MKWNNNVNLEKLVVLVTGSSGALGQEITKSFIDSNSIVYGFDNSTNMHLENENYHHINCDLTNFESFKKICTSIYENEKKINVLVNNAGITIPAKENKQYEEEAWNDTLKINLTVPFFCSQIVKDLMKENTSSSIINITSISAKLGFPNNPAYGASKGGLMALSKSLASEYAQFGIRVNCVGPGYVGEGMTGKSVEDDNIKSQRESMMMLKKWRTSEDVANACLFLASSASTYITGQDIYVDGGWTSKGFPDL